MPDFRSGSGVDDWYYFRLDGDGAISVYKGEREGEVVVDFFMHDTDYSLKQETFVWLGPATHVRMTYSRVQEEPEEGEEPLEMDDA